MSVWKTTTYKLDVARALYEKIPGACVTILGPSIGTYLSPAGELHELSAESPWDAVASVCSWDDEADDAEVASAFRLTYGSVKQWSVGASAVYQLIKAVHDNLFTCKAAYAYAALDMHAEAVGKLVMPSTQVTPGAYLTAWNNQLDDLWVRGQVYEDVSEGFKYLRYAFRNKDSDLIAIDQERFFGDGNRVYYGHVVNNLCLMRGAAIYTDKGLVLLADHCGLLTEALARIANIHYYVATEYANEPEAAKTVIAMLDLTIKAAARSRGKNADKVVQAFHKARMYAQMLIFENRHAGAMEEARQEFSKKGLADILSLEEYLTLISSCPINRRLDCLQVYKWMIPPDFDSTYAFNDLFSWHMATRPSGADPGASPELRSLWELVVQERKRNIVAAYHSQCKEWPVSPDNVACRPNNLHLWDLRKFFPYHTYGSDVVAQIKDKTTVPAQKALELRGAAHRADSSFLIWYMQNADNIDTELDADLLLSSALPEDNYAKVAYKGEAHKPGSRLFFMAPPRQRILLGELEGNISQIATFYPGSLQGRDAHQKAEILQKLFDIYEDPPDIDTEIQYELFIVTFDLSKFSPKSNPNVTHNYHDFWATVFGYDAIRAIGAIGPDSDIVHTQSGLVMQYKNQGADLEGFRGRMMTLFHADMLGAACRRARDLGFTTGKAVLAVFIDDGAVKVAVKGADAEALANANKFLATMQEIYEAAGQENHPNKTILSRVGGELLAEQFLNGARLKCAIKAAMRLYPDYENPACSIVEEFDALFAASQGAVKDQAKWVPTYRRYVVSFLKALYRWERASANRMSSVDIALKVITPKSFGGFGLQPFQGLASTVTLNLTAEGLGMLNRAGRMYPDLRDRVHRIVNNYVLQRDPLMILRDPERIRANCTALVENRLMMAIIRKLEEPGNAAANFMRGYNSEELKEHAKAVGASLLDQDCINLTLLARAWQCTPLAYVEAVVGKFRRAKTIISMLGYSKVGRIRSKNSADVKNILRAI